MLKKILILMSLVLFVAMGFLACAPGDNGDNGGGTAAPPVLAFTVSNTAGFGFFEAKDSEFTLLEDSDNVSASGVTMSVIGLNGIALGGTAATPQVFTVGNVGDADNIEEDLDWFVFYSFGDVYEPSNEEGEFNWTSNQIRAEGVAPRELKGKGIAVPGDGSVYVLSGTDDGIWVISVFPEGGNATHKQLSEKDGTGMEISDAVITKSFDKSKVIVVGVKKGTTDIYTWIVSEGGNDHNRAEDGKFEVKPDDGYDELFITAAAAPGNGSEIYVSVVGKSASNNLAGIVKLAGTSDYFLAGKETVGSGNFPYIPSIASKERGKVSYVLWEVSKNDGKWVVNESKIFFDADVSSATRFEDSTHTSLTPIVGGQKNIAYALATDGSKTYAVGGTANNNRLGYWVETSFTEADSDELGAGAKLVNFDDDSAAYPRPKFISKAAAIR